MALPPITVHIKRKATDEPVDFLRVQDSDSKRQCRASEYVFSRQQQPNDGTTFQSTPPLIIGTASPQVLNACTELSAVNKTRSHEENRDRGDSVLSPLKGSDASPPVKDASSFPPSLPRQFRLTRISPSAYKPLQDAGLRKINKGSIFVERKTRIPLSRPSRLHQSTSKPETIPQQTDINVTTTSQGTSYRQQKKPGRTSRLPPAVTEIGDVTQSSSIHNEQLIAELEAFTLEGLGRHPQDELISNHPSADNPTTGVASPPGQQYGLKQAKSRFKPKVPALRWSERHPEEAAALVKAREEQDQQSEVERQIKEQREAEACQDSEDMQIDEADYVIDTYFRMPIESMAVDEGLAAPICGLLVFDDASDLEIFYGGDEPISDEEDIYGDEDENAENHYTADYPEDEVDSDDEYGRDPYKYSRNRDEFVEDAFSDDDVDTMKYPWANSSIRARALKDKAGQDSDYSDDSL